jgi:signal transduction histidine kinase
MRSGSDHRPIFFRGRFQMRPYYLAVLSTLFGLGLRFALDPWLKDQMPYVTFLVSVALAGLYAGVRPALLSTALGAAVAYFCFIPPRYHWGFADISDAVGFLAYLGAALAIVALSRARNRAHEKANLTLQARINAERKLGDAHKLIQMFVDNRPGCSYLRDQTGRYVYFNNDAKRLLGIAVGDSNETEAQQTFEQQDQQVVESGGPLQFVHKVGSRNDERYLLTSKFLFTDQEGQIFVGSFSIDITDQMKAEQVELEGARLAGASQMVAMVAHEVNNPLAAVTSSLFLLGREVLPDRSRELVAIAEIELSRLAHITRLALGLYKEAKNPEMVHPCEMVDDAFNRLANRFSLKHVNIQRDFKWNDVFVASASDLRQLLDNVIANSLESGAGIIRVRVEQGKSWRMSTHLGIRISICDDGRGMSPQQYTHAFEPFFTTKSQKGTGLGLWISKVIALRNGGTISLRSATSLRRHGTCVSVFLPGHLLIGPVIGPAKSLQNRRPAPITKGGSPYVPSFEGVQIKLPG